MAAQALLFEGEQADAALGRLLVDGQRRQPSTPASRSNVRRITSRPANTGRRCKRVSSQQIGRFVRDIRAGNFPVASRDDKCTSYCDFSTVCRVAQVRSLGKQWSW